MQTNSITIALVANDHPESRDVGGKTVTKVRGRQSQGKDKDGEWRASVWLDVEAWGVSWAHKDLLALRKGDRFVVTGKLTVREWEGDNGKREFWGIRADSIDAPKRDEGGHRPGDEKRGGGWDSSTKHHSGERSSGHSEWDSATKPRDEDSAIEGEVW